MNPQPLRSFGRDLPIFTSAEAAARHRPAHALLAGTAVGLASSADHYLAGLLITFLGADAKPSFAMYEALHQTAKTQALRAAGHAVLDKDDRHFFDALMLLLKAVDKHRNRIAHWLWAYSEPIQDGLLLIDPASNFRMLVETSRRLAAGERIVRKDPNSGLDILVYTEKNLQDLVSTYEEISEYFRIFNVRVHPHLDKQPWHELVVRNAGALQTALARVRKQGSKSDTSA